MSSAPITLTAGAADKIGKRLVVAHRNGQELHRDKFDPDIAFHRAEFAGALWFKAHGSEPSDTERVSVGNAISAAVREHEAEAKAKPQDASDDTGSDRDSVAEKLVRLALDQYRFSQTDKGEAFSVAHDGPNIALMLRGSGDALRARLAREYRHQYKRTPTATALADALNVLEGESLDAEAEPVALRLAEHEDSIVLDLGDASGRAVIVGPDGWRVVDRSPVLYRRTARAEALPLPERGGSLDELRLLLNVSDDAWPLLVGWLVAALLPSIPHPILLLSGIQGTGKSSAARVIVGLLDPSPAPLRSEPRDAEQWSTAASGSWLVCLDNLSRVSGWFSDTLCKTVTGDGIVRRKLYTDGGLYVTSYKRVVILTSIDAGALRGDLGERLLLVELERIDEADRRTEHDLDRLLMAARPRIIGAILDAVAKVLSALPSVQPDRLPRMADFGRVLAACDAAGLTAGALEKYLAQQGTICGDVLEADPFGVALVELLATVGHWSGTASELLSALLPEGTRLPDGWPKPNGVTARIKRLIPALAAAGVSATTGERAANASRRRIIRLTRNAPESAVQAVQAVHHPPRSAQVVDDVDDVDNEIQTISFPPDANDLFAEAAEADAWGDA